MTPVERVVAEFGQLAGSLADRLGHQSVWKFADDMTVSADYTHHLEYCGVCRDLDAGGDGLGAPK